VGYSVETIRQPKKVTEKEEKKHSYTCRLSLHKNE